MTTANAIMANTIHGKDPSYLALGLHAARIPVVEFNPANKEHRRAYLNFVNNGKWDIKFATKFPKSIEQTVQAALALHACKKEMAS